MNHYHKYISADYRFFNGGSNLYVYVYIESKLKCNTNSDLFLEAN